MGSVSEIVKKVDELCPNATEFMFFDMRISLGNLLDIENAIKSWSILYRHKLRLPNQRSRFKAIGYADLQLKIHQRLTEELVYRGSGASAEQAQSLVCLLLTNTGAIDALFHDFLIDDWAICELLLVRCEEGGFILSFLGED